MAEKHKARTGPDRKFAAALAEIQAALEDMRFGSLTVIVQDGIVVQLDKTSKLRLDYSALERLTDGEGI